MRTITTEQVLSQAKSIAEMMRARGLISFPPLPDDEPTMERWASVMDTNPLSVPTEIARKVNRRRRRRRQYRRAWTSRNRALKRISICKQITETEP